MNAQPQAVVLDAGDPFCSQCGVQFQPRRSNQTYCDRQCQKAASHNTARGSQKAAHNHGTARQLEVNRHRGFLLYDLYRKAAPADRPALLEKIVAAARDHDWFLRRKLSDPKLLAVRETYGVSEWNRWAFLVQACDQHCRLRWGVGARIYLVVQKNWIEPEEIRALAHMRLPSEKSEEPLLSYQKVETDSFFGWWREEVAPKRKRVC